jgi:hypothetical protein
LKNLFGKMLNSLLSYPLIGGEGGFFLEISTKDD